MSGQAPSGGAARNRLARVTLDEASIGRSNPDVEHERRVAERGVFDDFGEAGAHFAIGERCNRSLVAKDDRRLMKRPGEILAGGDVDGGLAADGAVDLCEEAGRNLRESAAALEQRRGEAGDVADDAARSLAEHRIIPQNAPRTIADGLLTSLGELTFAVIHDLVERVITVTEDEIIAAMRLAWERAKLLIEPSAAVPLAAMLSAEGKALTGIGHVGVILSGGNVNLDELPWKKRID